MPRSISLSTVSTSWRRGVAIASTVVLIGFNVSSVDARAFKPGDGIETGSVGSWLKHAPDMTAFERSNGFDDNSAAGRGTLVASARGLAPSNPGAARGHMAPSNPGTTQGHMTPSKPGTTQGHMSPSKPVK